MGRSEQLPSLVAALDIVREKPGASAAIAAAASVLGVIVLASVGKGKVRAKGTIFPVEMQEYPSFYGHSHQKRGQQPEGVA